MLNAIIPGRKFPFPKSLYAVEDALRFYLQNKPEAMVLDFFGGSGTTTHAVARLNRQDGGQRRSILVTNNEVSPDEANSLRGAGLTPGDDSWEAQGICEFITKPRIISAFTGKTPNGSEIVGSYRFGEKFPMSEGFNENVEFFKLTYEDPALISLGRRFNAIAPLLWLKAGATGEMILEIDPIGWSSPLNACYAVLFDSPRWSDFARELERRPAGSNAVHHVFIVTDSESEFQHIASRLRNVPSTRLYSDYLQTFEINTIEK